MPRAASPAGCSWEVMVEIVHEGQRVASHRRSAQRGGFTTPRAPPKSHQAHAEWTPSRFIGGRPRPAPHPPPADRRPPPPPPPPPRPPHPEQGYRSCVGILRLAKRYDAARHDHAPELVTADVH